MAWPNPVSINGVVNISTQKGNDIQQISITDVIGKSKDNQLTEINGSQATINTDGMKSGVYIFLVKTNMGTEKHLINVE